MIRQGAVAFRNVAASLLEKKADSRRQDRIIKSLTVCFLVFAQFNTTEYSAFVLLDNLVEVCSQFTVLYPSMKVIYVLSYSHQYAFGINIRLSPTKKLPERSIFFPQCEGSFGLNASIDSKLYAFIACYTFKAFFALPLERP